MKRCDICFDPAPSCKEASNVDKCGTCSNQSKCHRYLRPTIRVTTKCTQSCNHCCYSCSPESSDMMSVSIAKQISTFLKNHQVRYINLMGGEIWLNPDWKEILHELIENVPLVRVVSNGDFIYGNPEFVPELAKYEDKIRLSISKDKWHKPLNVEKITQYLDNQPIIYNIAGDNQLSNLGIVPIGKAEFEMSMFSMLQTYCSNPESSYSFLIDEVGDIFKCPFGIWKIGNISSFQEESSFFPIFKEKFSLFRKVGVFTCSSCIRAHDRVKDERDVRLYKKETNPYEEENVKFCNA